MDLSDTFRQMKEKKNNFRRILFKLFKLQISLYVFDVIPPRTTASTSQSIWLLCGAVCICARSCLHAGSCTCTELLRDIGCTNCCSTAWESLLICCCFVHQKRNSRNHPLCPPPAHTSHACILEGKAFAADSSPVLSLFDFSLVNFFLSSFVVVFSQSSRALLTKATVMLNFRCFKLTWREKTNHCIITNVHN